MGVCEAAKRMAELFEVKTNFLLGAYSVAVREAEKVSGDGVDKRFYLYRSYIGLGDFPTVIAELADEDAESLQAVRVLAQYLSAKENEESGEQYVAEMDKLVEKYGNAGSVLLVAAVLFAEEGNREQCIRLAHQSADLEAKALLVQQYLASGRVDLAEKEYQKM